ncbi:MAG: universal stress protein [Verrucomicrobia bacterium]|nr:MAG: universal stress protein [Verrucomicrobiota bacterium]
MKTNTTASRSKTAASAVARGLTTMARSESSTRTKSDPVLLRIKSILVPIDFSTSSKKALQYAVPFARQFGAKLTLLHVVEPVATPDFANSFPLMMENDKVKAASRGQLEHIIKEQAIAPKLVEKTLVRFGRSFHEIADAARTLKVDLIIISTHGYTGLKHALLGSTTERVVRYAPCPVLVVREREHEFVQAD